MSLGSGDGHVRYYNTKDKLLSPLCFTQFLLTCQWYVFLSQWIPNILLFFFLNEHEEYEVTDVSKRQNAGTGSDIISYSPESVLTCILSLLPTKQLAPVYYQKNESPSGLKLQVCISMKHCFSHMNGLKGHTSWTLWQRYLCALRWILR